MKNKYLILLISLVLGFSATSCDDFLDEMPDNRTELDTEDKILKIITSAYPTASPLVAELMSDNMDDWGTSYGGSADRDMQQAWNWEASTETSNDSPTSLWQRYYLAIAHANQALQAIEELGNPEHLNPYRGEALMCRAYSHFMLVNLFCQHYTEEFGDTDLGIPYMKAPETQVNPTYTRGTVKQVYKNIDEDIQIGLPLIDDNIYTVPKYHFNRQAAYGFAAQFYLYYRDYDKVIEYANEALGSKPETLMRDLAAFRQVPAQEPQTRAYVSTGEKANFLLMTNVSNIGLLMLNYNYGKRYVHSSYTAETEGMYANNALWRTSSTTRSTFLMPIYSVNTSGPSYMLRFSIPYLFEMLDPVLETGYRHSITPIITAENVLLCRAEAYVLKNNFSMAMDDLNLWVKTHIVAAYAAPKTEAQIESYFTNLPYYTSKNPTTKKALNPEETLTAKQEAFIHAILHVRRIEFYGEGTRWFDVKRYGIEITRRQLRATGGVPEIEETDILKPRDYRRAVQLPASVITAGLQGNPREN